MQITLADANAEIEPVPATGGGCKPEPELTYQTSQDSTQWGNIPWADADRVQQLIAEDTMGRRHGATTRTPKQHKQIAHRTSSPPPPPSPGGRQSTGALTPHPRRNQMDPF